jgi:ABC-type oligopeptide transport system ATPase subunit
VGNETMIEVKHLKKYFKTAYGMLHAVDDVSFEIKKGQTLGVVGESGCGKSTLGRVMIHLLEATSGEVIFNGKDVTKAGTVPAEKGYADHFSGSFFFSESQNDSE